MAVAVNLKKIDEWFSAVNGQRVVKADSAFTQAKQAEWTLESIKAFAERCEWVELEDVSSTLYAREGHMHPQALAIGRGDFIDALKGKPGTEIHFFNAYRV